MKPLLVFFIAFMIPVVLFIATILYGDSSNDKLKLSLVKSGIYEQLNKRVAKEDPTINDPFLPIVQDRFTPGYIKLKTESVLDESTLWISGKASEAPVLTFQEFKIDLENHAPELLAGLQNVPDESELIEAGVDQKQREAYLQQAKAISDFTKQGFTIKLEQHLQPFRTVYHGFKIVLPIIVIIIIGCFVLLWKLTEGLPAKFKWLGITFVFTALVGYGAIFFNAIITDLIAQINILNDSEFGTVITPIFLAVLNHFIQNYTAYQHIAGIILLIAAALSFFLMIYTRKQAVKTLKPLTIKRSYWEKPFPKK